MSQFFKIITVAISWVVLIIGEISLSAHENKLWTSPDGRLVAQINNVKAPGSADYTDWDIVTVRDRNHTLRASLSLEEGSGVNRTVVTTAAWSSDARFFVFVTTSSGGHSSWHMPSFVFDASSSCIYSIDDTIADTTDDNPQFELTKSDVLKIRFWNGANEEAEAMPRTIDLRDFVQNRPKLAFNFHRLSHNSHRR